MNPEIFNPALAVLTLLIAGLGGFFIGRWSAKRRRTDHLYVRGPLLGLRRTNQDLRL